MALGQCFRFQGTIFVHINRGKSMGKSSIILGYPILTTHGDPILCKPGVRLGLLNVGEGTMHGNYLTQL